MLGNTEQGMLLMRKERCVPFWDVVGIKAVCATLLGETPSPVGQKDMLLGTGGRASP